MGVISDDQFERITQQIEKESSTNTVYPYVLTLISFIIICFGNGLVVLLTATTRSLRTAPNVLLANMSAAAFILGALALVQSIQSIIGGSFVAVGAVGCVLQGATGLTVCAVFVISIATTAYERYICIVKANDMKLSRVMTVILCTWLTSMVVGYLPALSQRFDIYILRPCGLYCVLRWSDTSIAGRLAAISAVLIVCVSLSLASYFYYQIIQITLPEQEQNWRGMIRYVGELLFEKPDYVPVRSFNMLSSTKFSTRNGTTTTTSKNEILEMIYQSDARRAMQRLLVRKSITIVLLFTTFWMPFFLTTLYEIFSGNTPNPTIDLICFLGVLANGFANPVFTISKGSKFWIGPEKVYRMIVPRVAFCLLLLLAISLTNARLLTRQEKSADGVLLAPAPGQPVSVAAPSPPVNDAELPIPPKGSSVPKQSYFNSFIASLLMIIVSELGDKTFLIAALLAMRHSRLVVLLGALSALFFMTVLSAQMGRLLPWLMSREWASRLSALLFLVFGLKMIHEGIQMQHDKVQEELDEAAEELDEEERKVSTESALESGKSPMQLTATAVPWRSNIWHQWKRSSIGKLIMHPIYWQALTMTAVGEWGDRSQISTVAMAAAQDVWAITFGALLGHTLCTILAVVGGRLLASRISVKHVTLGGGFLFIIFGILAFLEQE